MKDHEIAKLVNDLHDIAVRFHDDGYLREKIHHRLVPEIEQLRTLLSDRQKLNQDLEKSNTGLAEEIARLRDSRIRLTKIAFGYRKEFLQFRKRLELAHAIRNDAEHKTVMERIGELMPSDPMPDTPDGEELSLLVALAMAYETERYSRYLT